MAGMVVDLGRALRDLFPPGVATAAALVGVESAPLPWDEELAVRGAPARRRAEFSSGRACARAALASLGLRDSSIPMEADGSPRWPVGVVGSLSHSGGLCVAAVAARDGFAGIGLDIQEFRELTPDRAPLFCSEEERIWIDAHLEEERPLATLLLFCAKESAGKCFPWRPHWPPVSPGAEVRATALPGTFVAWSRRFGSPESVWQRAQGRIALRGEFVLAGAVMPERV